MMSPRVSVVVVTYNQEEWAAESVRSALDQDYPDLEVIVADDGSADRTPEILKELEAEDHDRLRLLLGATNVGLSRNLNRALEVATGDLVAFLAGDDAFLPGKVSTQVEWMAAARSRVACGHDVEVVSADGAPRARYSSDAPLWSGDGAEEVIRKGMPFPATSLMVRADRMPPGRFDERMVVNADWLFLIDCLLEGGEYAPLPGVLGRYRVHSGSLTSQFRSDLRVAQTTFEEAITMLGEIESRYPVYRRAVTEQKARQHAQLGWAALMQGDRVLARQATTRGLRHSIRIGHLGWLAMLFTYTPRRLADVTLKAAKLVRSRRTLSWEGDD